MIYCLTSLRGDDMRLVGTIVSSFLACVLLILGGVHNGRLALKIKGVIGHHAVRVFVYDCRAIKKPEANNLGYKFLWWALPGLNR